MNCGLCGSETTVFSTIKKRIYYHCNHCDGISLHQDFFLSKEQEKERYQAHNNDLADPGYQNFVSPIVHAVVQDYKKTDTGLDFGSGSAPIVASMLQEKTYNITTYDPFFDPKTHVLDNTYNYITCCEVMEHFYYPKKEFALLYSLLKEKGSLYCKTYLYDPSIDFDTWWYKNDNTHVFFYTKKTLDWIKNHFNFSQVNSTATLIVFKK